MSAPSRPRLAVYWAAGCGGCEAAFLDLGERLLEIGDRFEIVLFPLLLDLKFDRLSRIGEGEIDLCLFTGAIRTEHDRAMARELRRLSSTMVALGACAHSGSVLALADTGGLEELLGTVFPERSSRPQTRTPTPAGTLELPDLTPRVRALEDEVPVDHVIPGCPPEHGRLWEALMELAGWLDGAGATPPQRVLGATDVAVCEECPRQRPEGPVDRFFRLHEIDGSSERCLLDLGLVCSGPATRGGCGAPCVVAGAPCRGCYGPLSAVEDQGARTMSALTALAGPVDPVEEGRMEKAARALAASVVDPVGTLYRYGFAASLLSRLRGEDRCDG